MLVWQRSLSINLSFFVNIFSTDWCKNLFVYEVQFKKERKKENNINDNNDDNDGNDSYSNSHNNNNDNNYLENIEIKLRVSEWASESEQRNEKITMKQNF